MALYQVKVSGLVTRELEVEAESGSQAQEIAKTMFCEMLLAYPDKCGGGVMKKLISLNYYEGIEAGKA